MTISHWKAGSDAANGQTDGNGEELADVVIAKETVADSSVPWYVALRPWLFCLAFLMVAEIGARLYFDHTLCLLSERFDNYPGPAIENAFVAQMRRDPAYKVVIIGDSTVVGASLLKKNETMPRLLEVALNRMVPEREIHVWNLSLAGARASDEWCLLKKAFEGKPDLVVIEGNYFISDMELWRQPLMNPWVAYSLPEIPASLAPVVPKREPKQVLEDNLTDLIEGNIRLIGLRQVINVKLFGVQPRRQPFDVANPMVMEAVTIAKQFHQLQAEDWKKGGMAPHQHGWLYQYGIRPIGPDNINGRYYREIIADLQRHHVPAITYLTPQNAAVTHEWILPQKYVEYRKVLSAFMTGDNIPNYDFCELVPDALFADNDHMLGAGNSRLAEALAAVIAPKILSKKQ